MMSSIFSYCRPEEKIIKRTFEYEVKVTGITGLARLLIPLLAL